MCSVSACAGARTAWRRWWASRARRSMRCSDARGWLVCGIWIVRRAYPSAHVRVHPGEPIHVDMKRLGRVPAGGGHRILGREQGRRGRGIGYDVVHVAVDDASRLAVAQLLPDDRGPTAARFLLNAAASSPHTAFGWSGS